MSFYKADTIILYSVLCPWCLWLPARVEGASSLCNMVVTGPSREDRNRSIIIYI